MSQQSQESERRLRDLQCENRMLQEQYWGLEQRYVERQSETPTLTITTAEVATMTLTEQSRTLVGRQDASTEPEQIQTDPPKERSQYKALKRKHIQNEEYLVEL